MPAASTECRHGRTGFCWDDATPDQRGAFDFAYDHAYAWAKGGGRLDLAAVTTEAVYELPRPVRMVGEHTDHRLDAVRVRITRYPGATSEGDKTGRIEVEGYLRPMNRTGALRANGVPVWRRLPEALALPLISRALTQG
jgi:hypothetical protein